MALMFPWATKEYLLWEMSLGQIIMYYNLGIEIKNGSKGNGKKTLQGKSYRQLSKLKKELKDQGLSIEEPIIESMKRKYGDV